MNTTFEPVEDPSHPRRTIGAWTVALLWLLVALVFVLQNIVTNVTADTPIHWRSALLFELEYWLVFAAFSPLFAWVARRFRFEAGRRWRSFAAHGIAALAVAAIQPVAAHLLNYLTVLAVHAPNDADRFRLPGILFRDYGLLALIALWKYAIIVGVFYAFDYYRQFRDHQLRGAHLEGELAMSQLRTLRMQLDPHFLFNVLNSAAMLATSDPPRAQLVLTRLAELLRSTLDASAPLEVPLLDELEFLDRYLELERIRFEERLMTRFAISDEAGGILVPSLILQPLVENAIRHGARHSAERQSITVRGRRDTAGMLVLEVEDNGPGLPAGWTFVADAGTGLGNVQRRIDAAHGQPRPMEFLPVLPQGLLIRLTLPAR